MHSSDPLERFNILLQLGRVIAESAKQVSSSKEGVKALEMLFCIHEQSPECVLMYAAPLPLPGDSIEQQQQHAAETWQDTMQCVCSSGCDVAWLCEPLSPWM